MNIWAFLSIATILRLILANLFPLTADESYYWLWAKHLSLSFVDHPPMVGLINYLTTFGTENLFMLRMGVVIITLLVSLFIYLLANEIFNEKVAFWSVVLFQIIPHFVVVWLTMFVELPLVLFWTLSLYLLSRIIKYQHPTSIPACRQARLASSPISLTWLLLGITIGLGYLSKYTMLSFWLYLAVFFILSPESRFWLKRKELYLAFIISSFFLLPVLYWNYQHQWISFAFHSERVGGDPLGANTISFIADQLVHFTPFLIFTLLPVLKYALRKNTETKLLFSFSALPLLLFLALSLKMKVWAHWPSVGYIAAIPLTVDYLLENGKSLKKFILWISLFASIILLLLFWVSPGILLHQKDYALNYQLKEKLPGIKIFARTNVSASLLEFYTRRPTYLATGFLKPVPLWGEKQYELWDLVPLSRK